MALSTRKRPEKRIGLLYLKTGGGHYSAARALQQYINENAGGRAKALLFDPIPEHAAAAQMVLQDGYRFTSHKIGKLWILLYEFSKLKAVDYIWSFFVFLTTRKNLLRFVRTENIDTVVILHFLLSRPLRWALKNLQRKPELVRVVTDPFTAHSLWFNCPGIRTIVFSERLYRYAAGKYPGLKKSLLLFPPVLGKEFSSEADPEQVALLRERFGFSKSEEYLLFAGGGEGFPKGLRYIADLLKQGLGYHILLVCGKDGSLRGRAEKLRRYFPEAPFTVFGYVDFMAELMQLARVVITKGGPATIMEALKCGKPVIVIQYLYGQERGNMEYVAQNRFGFYVSSPSKLSALVRKLRGDARLYSDITERIRGNPPRNGTAEIADYILSL